jgi:DNA-binding MarR family transcriptional regulator
MANAVQSDVHISQVNDAMSHITMTVIADVLEALQDHDMSMSRFAVLHLLDVSEGMTITTVAAKLKLSIGSASQLIDRLEIDRFVMRQDDNNDRRIRRIWLTDQGAHMISRMKKIRLRRMSSLLQNTPPHIIEQLCATMHLMIPYLSKDSL